ncbi:MerR family transcriptional regulator [Williamsia sp. MIQD14]|uniref:MerR family transcriptional regulator n=1 Tax=Williamsia sp. MIQD14 TaxID=3425703 RepID=UPI003DA0E428
MKISELSRRSGVSVATIKYYLREDVLPAGEPTSSNQASYGDGHLRRLRLIRALIDIGGLSLARVRDALAATENDELPLHDAFGAVMLGLDDPGMTVADDDTVGEVRDWLADRNWTIAPDAPATRRLAELIGILRTFGLPVTAESFSAAADTAEATAIDEVRYAHDQPDRIASVEMMLIGTVVYERAMAMVRRLALEAASARIDDGTGIDDPARG